MCDIRCDECDQNVGLETRANRHNMSEHIGDMKSCVIHVTRMLDWRQWRIDTMSEHIGDMKSCVNNVTRILD